MSVTVPPSLLIVLQVLRPCFTAPSYLTMSAVVTGALSASGPRTVTGMWTAASPIAAQDTRARFSDSTLTSEATAA